MSVCVKCGCQMSGQRIRYCGPTQRFSWCPTQHTMSDATEHLVSECDSCGHYTTAPCAQATA